MILASLSKRFYWGPLSVLLTETPRGSSHGANLGPSTFFNSLIFIPSFGCP